MKWVRRIGCLTVLVLIVTVGTVVFLFTSSRAMRNETAGRTVRGNVAVLGGDVRIAEDERIPGNLLIVGDDLVLEGRIGGSLVVVGGDVELVAEAGVGGDISVIGGDADVRGASEVGGNVAVVGGDVDLRESARVGGNVSVVGGEMSKDPNVHVGGGASWQAYTNGAGGMNLSGETPAPLAQFYPPRAPEPPEALAEVVESRDNEVQAQIALHRQAELEAVAEAEALAEARQEAAMETAAEARGRAASARRPWLLVFFGKLLQAFLWTLLFTGLVLLVSWLLPKQVKAISKTAERETALSFATGAIGMLGSAGLTAILMITVCFALLALPLLALMAVVALCGWTVTCYWLGRRLDELVAVQGDVSWNPLISVGISSLAVTGITAFSWAIFPCLGFIAALLIGSTGTGAVIVHVARGSGRLPRRVREDAPPDGPAGPDPGAEAGPAGTEEGTGGEESGADAGSADSLDAAGPESAEQTAADLPEPGEAQSLLATEDHGTADALPGDPAVQDTADDFTRIGGIGTIYARRLVEAGVTRYSQLAAMDTDRIAMVIGCPAARVERERLREQAGALAERD